jgi:hypothetical protein
VGFGHGCLFGDRPRVRPAARGGRAQYRARGPAAWVAGGSSARVRERARRSVPSGSSGFERSRFYRCDQRSHAGSRYRSCSLECWHRESRIFYQKTLADLLIDVRLSVTSHLELCHHFAPVLVERGRGGILLVGMITPTVLVSRDELFCDGWPSSNDGSRSSREPVRDALVSPRDALRASRLLADGREGRRSAQP